MWGMSAYCRSKTVHSRSKQDTVYCLPRRPGGRKLLTCEQALEVQETFIGSWHLHGDLRLQLSRVHCTFKHSCRGVRVHAAGWDTGLSSGTRVFLEWVNIEMTTKVWLGAEADGKTEIWVLVPTLISFVFLQITNKCLKRCSFSSLGCFGGLEQTPGIASNQLSVLTLSLQVDDAPNLSEI